MSNINYVIREDGMPVLLDADEGLDFLDLEVILKDYPYIVESMKNEGYIVDNDICYFFDEIVYENKVVGFAAFDFYNDDAITLTECYILPEFRGKKLFLNEISKMTFSAPSFGILQPTRHIVELLVDYSFAEEVSGDIVVSGIDLYFNDLNTKSNKRDEIEGDIPASNFYDLGICSTILVDGDEVIYHNLLEKDLKINGIRKELGNDYFDNIIKLFSKNQGEFETLINELKMNVPTLNLGFDEIIGHSDDLSEFMQGLVDNEIISHDKALEFKQRLTEEYESGQIADGDIDDRLTQLIMSETPDSLLFDDFQDFLNSPEYADDEDMKSTKEFFKIMNDKQLGEDLFKAILSDDFEEFEDLVVDAMDKDGEFSKRFLSFANDWGGGDELPRNDEFYDMINSHDLNFDSPYPIGEMMWGPNDKRYKLDDTFYGKDHPISNDHYMFRVLNSLKEGMSLNAALETAEMEGKMTSQAVENILFMMNLISDEVNYDNWDEFANDSLNINDLKNILRKNNLKVSGKKQELIDRIAENQIPLEEFKTGKVTVTPDGDAFLMENQWIDFYDTFLDKFDFNDFLKYLEEHNGEFIDLTYEYLEKHLKLAKKEKNQQYIDDCIAAKDLISQTGEKYLKNIYD